ncbi:MAG: DNA recombination protein RmuC [Candidatus Moduliflexus flocculans]|nr:DNA recombination protein RmuC [Candidatus Moduliflexus flocculans]
MFTPLFHSVGPHNYSQGVRLGVQGPDRQPRSRGRRRHRPAHHRGPAPGALRRRPAPADDAPPHRAGRDAPPSRRGRPGPHRAGQARLDRRDPGLGRHGGDRAVRRRGRLRGPGRPRRPPHPQEGHPGDRPGPGPRDRGREGPGPRGPPRPGPRQLRGPVAGGPQGQHGRSSSRWPGRTSTAASSSAPRTWRTKKQLIDQNLAAVKGDLQKMQDLVAALRVRAGPASTASSTPSSRPRPARPRGLQDTADHLRQALVSTKARGQWGERMAEDVLRLAGFVEGVNYIKQTVLDMAASRPDYTFRLPQGLKVNMDVKFPLNSYLRYLEAGDEAARESHKAQFLRDVRTRIKEVTTRDYINPEEKTLDYVLVFIPNEQVYAFINENDSGIMDEALKAKVILCSPFTLFAILAIIRQSPRQLQHGEDGRGDPGPGQELRAGVGEVHGLHGQDGGQARSRPQGVRPADGDAQGQARPAPCSKIEDIRRLKGIGEAGPIEAEAEVPALEPGATAPGRSEDGRTGEEGPQGPRGVTVVVGRRAPASWPPSSSGRRSSGRPSTPTPWSPSTSTTRSWPTARSTIPSRST